jgi:hypothetical protein
LDYEKHCAGPFGAYVQANHETNQMNSHAARTLDAINLRPALNMQGGHELYDLNSGRAIEQIAEDQGFKTLKFKNRKGTIYHDADWIAGVDYDENIQQDIEDDKAYEDNENDDQDEDENVDDKYDRIDEEELEDLLQDEREQTNPNQHREDEGQGEDEAKEEEESEDNRNAVVSEQETDSQGSQLRRSTRESRPVSRLEPNMSGKSYLQNDKKTIKKVAFAEDELKHLEYCHNLVCQVKPEKEKIIEYGSCQAMLIARFIQDIMMNNNQHRASFAQQYMLQKGLKVFGEKRHDTSKKEIDQLHKRTCFAPLR